MGFNSDFRFYGEDTDLARRLSKVGAVKFSLALPAFSSGRRFAGEGLVKVGLRYAANYSWAILFKHPLTLTWLDFRRATDVSGNRTLVAADAVRAEPPQP